jgi:hypothetical protein
MTGPAGALISDVNAPAFLILKEGLDMKAASRLLKHTRAISTDSCQWKLLRKYQKKLKGGWISRPEFVQYILSGDVDLIDVRIVF